MKNKRTFGLHAEDIWKRHSGRSLHNLIHLAIGVSGIWAARRLEWAQLWGKVIGVTLLVIFVVGMAQAAAEGYPIDQILLGLVVLNSPGHTLHLATGLIALYLGLASSRTAIE